MKEISIEEKAKAYDKAIAMAKECITYVPDEIVNKYILNMFPELKESEDEKIKKDIIKVFKGEISYTTPEDSKKYIAWLEKQVSPDMVADAYLKGCNDTEKKWLEKQGDKEQLYIRFGEIPTDEKSKIYQGEIEVGIENGVSVYPAFKTNEGNIVLGLNLPVTKTTLYTLQGLIEYENRPCYLVKGNYVGKDTDGQPSINNVNIIEKIDNYRVKEKKQDEQKTINKDEPKFKVGDWIVLTAGELSNTLKIVNVDTNKRLYWFNDSSYLPIVDEEYLHLWTIKDAKDGDVLYCKSSGIEYIAMNKGVNKNGNIDSYFRYNSLDGFGIEIPSVFSTRKDDITPATKEQRDFLFKKMREECYEWDGEKKELSKLNNI